MADDDAVSGAPARVVGIGASAGGVDALIRLVANLPGDTRAAFLVVLHVPATSRSLLAPILDRRGALTAEVAVEGEPLRADRIYVAPPDRHMVAEDGRIRLLRGPKENGSRPAVDPLLRSLAAVYGPAAVAVILSGALGDGSDGAAHVKRAGGTVIVQAPADATVPSMPESALATVAAVEAVLPAAEIGPALARLATARMSRGRRPWRPSPEPRAASVPRGRRRRSRARSATARCGRSRPATPCATAAASGTPIPRTP